MDSSVFVGRIGAVLLQFVQARDDLPVFRLGPGRRILRIFPARSGHGLLHDVADLRDLVNAHERVHFGQQFGQFVAKTLRQAAGNDEAWPRWFGLAQLRRIREWCPRFPPARSQ